MNEDFSVAKYTELIQNGKFEEASEYQASFIPDFLYKFVPLYGDGASDDERNLKRFSSLERSEIWFSSWDAMNDPFEFAGIYIDELKLRNSGWSPENIARIKRELMNLFFWRHLHLI